MTDLEQLIETGYRLSNTLSVMADNEIKFGFDLCHRMEQISYDMYKSAEEMRMINSYIVGDSV